MNFNIALMSHIQNRKTHPGVKIPDITGVQVIYAGEPLYDVEHHPYIGGELDLVMYHGAFTWLTPARNQHALYYDQAKFYHLALP